MDNEIKKAFEDLTLQIKLGFDEMTENFCGVYVRLDKLETRMDHVETRLDGVESRLDGVETRLDEVDVKLHGVETQVKRLGTRISNIESTYITKAYLDEKMLEQEGRFISLLRSEDNKVYWLGNVVRKKKVMSAQEFKEFQTLTPFGTSQDA